MEDNKNKNSQKHSIIIENRSKMQITGVNQVISAQPNVVVVKTNEGGLTISGNDLHVEKLVLEDSYLEVVGSVLAIKYNNNVGKSFFKRLFK
ncbi:MAG: sporulation protein YabP [Clostridia bacterium]|nr:sporulation protein YabP [Clostridia bacterium]